MTDETYSFDQARVRLEEIASQVKRKDTSLEQSLDLLEEGVRLANMCTEQIDHTQWRAPEPTPAEPSAEEGVAAAGTEVAEGVTPDDAAPEDESAEAGDDAGEPAEEAPEPAAQPPYDQAAEA